MSASFQQPPNERMNLGLALVDFSRYLEIQLDIDKITRAKVIVVWQAPLEANCRPTRVETRVAASLKTTNKTVASRQAFSQQQEKDKHVV